MAPVPITLEVETKELIDALRRREKDLTEYQVPRLRDCTGLLSVQQRFAAELREDLDVFGRQVETLEIHVDDMARRADRLAVKQFADEFRESGLRIRKDLRAALLHSKRVIDVQASTNREELFRAATPVSRSVEDKATDDALMKASNDVTESLRRTIGLMQGELERSVLSHQMLEQSSASLRATSIQHDVLAAATRTSRQLVTALEKADWLDRVLILAALAFFVLVVLFILKQRILDRGLRLAFWWTRFLPAPGSGGSERDGGILKNAVSSAVQEKSFPTALSSAGSSVETVMERLTTAVASTVSAVSDSANPSDTLSGSLSVSSVILESSASTIGSVPTLDVLSESVLKHAEL
ncbi:hypothetical protein M0805_001837 [Coniferiporia weirii]|nr:hypothetical protein M0805_001837 [Coniferiporia weirii]